MKFSKSSQLKIFEEKVRKLRNIKARLLHCLVLFLWYVRGNQDLTGQVFNVVLASCLAAISWARLTDESTRKHFA